MTRFAFLVVRAKATLLPTGAGPTMYKMMAPSAEKTTDGLAMAYRIGARFVDMEMVQFHPIGLLVGDSGMSGTVLEEGLRGIGGHLFIQHGGEDVYILRDKLKALMWEKAGLVRSASHLESARKALADIRERARYLRDSGSPRLNAEWQEWLNLDSLLTVSAMIVASALQRKESRGSDYRSDYPEPDNSRYLQHSYLQWDGEGMHL